MRILFLAASMLCFAAFTAHAEEATYSPTQRADIQSTLPTYSAPVEQMPQLALKRRAAPVILAPSQDTAGASGMQQNLMKMNFGI